MQRFFSSQKHLSFILYWLNRLVNINFISDKYNEPYDKEQNPTCCFDRYPSD